MTFKASPNQKKEPVAPSRCFLQSCTQIGSKMLLYGGSDKDGPESYHKIYPFMLFSFHYPTWFLLHTNHNNVLCCLGEPLDTLFLYDSINFQWSRPKGSYEDQEDYPGPRYGHTATLIDMHVSTYLTLFILSLPFLLFLSFSLSLFFSSSLALFLSRPLLQCGVVFLNLSISSHHDFFFLLW